MTQARKVLASLSSMTVMRFGTAALSFVLFWSISRWSGSSMLGAYAIVMNAFLFLQQMPMLGLHLALIRDAAAEPASLPERLSALALIAVVVAVLLGLVLAAAALVAYPPDLQYAMWLIAASMPPTAITVVAESALLGRQRVNVIATVNILENLFRVGMTLILIAAGSGLNEWFAVFLVGRIAAAAAYLLMGLRQSPDAIRQALPKAELARYFRQVPVFFGILLASTAFNRLDVFVMSHYLDLKDVGLYAAAGKLYEMALMASSILIASLYPMLVSVRATDQAKFRLLVETALRWLLVLGIPAAAFGSMISKELMQLVFGERYLAAAPILACMAPTALFMAMNQFFSSAMLASEAQRQELMAVAGACIGLLLLLLWLIPYAGGLGTAWAVMTAMLIQLMLRAWLFKRVSINWSLLDVVSRPLLAGAVLIAVWLVLYHWHFLAAAVLSMAAYAGCLVLLKVVSLRDLGLLQATLAGLRVQRPQ